MTVVDGIFFLLAFGLAFSLVGMGLFLSNKVFKLVDLTCESSFALGGCVYGSMVLSGMNPLMAIVISMFLGYILGAITASLISYIKMDPIMAGLLTVGGTQSLLTKLVEMKKFNPSIFGNLSPGDNFVIAVILVGTILFLFYRLITSEYGLSMRIYGNGAIITESMGINGIRILSIGLGIENLLCALAGALIAQMTGDFAVNMGSGCIIFGVSAILLGEKIFDGTSIRTAIVGAFVGSMCYEALLKFLASREMIGLGEEYNNMLMAISLMMLVALRPVSQENYSKDHV